MKDVLDDLKREMGASNAEDAEFLEMAEYFDSLDAEDLDDLDDAEYAEYLDYAEALEMAERKHGRAKVGLALRKGARKGGKGKKPKSSILRKRDKLVAVGGGGSFAKPGTVNRSAPTFGSPSFINQMMTQSKGDLNITVTRESININANLPLVLFGLQGFQSSYNSIIKQYLPANVTLVASTDPNNGDVLLTYTNSVGPVSDVIRISLTGSQISYSEFLQSMNQNYFSTRYIRQEYVNNANLLSAVSQTINFGLLSSLGMKNQNSLLPRSRRLNSDYQTFIINLFLPEQKITSDFSFVQQMIPAAGQVIAYDVFMSGRKNLNNL
jgi:hypothetical protein